METKRIRAMLLAIEKGSMAQAAADYSYTPSAFSHMADSLEEELGVKLIVRAPSGVTLTEQGRELLPKMRELLRAEDELILSAQRISRGAEYELRIGAYASVLHSILPEILHLFKEKHPEIKVSIAVGNSLAEWLKNENADVIFADETTLHSLDPILTIKDPFVVVVPKDKFKGKTCLTREELYENPFIMTNQSILRKYFDESRFADLIHFDSVDDASVIAMVREGVGITVLPKLVTHNDRKGVRVLKLKPDVWRMLGFAHNKQNGVELSYALKAFLAFLAASPLGRVSDKIR